MRTSDADILIIPSDDGLGPDHWQSRWEGSLSSARRVDPPAGDRPAPAAWAARIVAEVERATRPVILVAHGLGVLAVAQAAPRLAGKVAGAFLVTPPSPQRLASLAGADPAFADLPSQPLPFPAIVVASRDDPHADYADSETLAQAWNVPLVDAGHSGHIDAESGHGPWPEGLMRFAGFLKSL